jgi:hypothetical protein
LAGVDVLKVVAEIREKHPDQRLGQLLWNALSLGGYWMAPEANKLFYMDDKELITNLKIMGIKDDQRKIKDDQITWARSELPKFGEPAHSEKYSRRG